MTLDQISYFLELCNTLHYTKASKNLNISQPSLSYAIKQLEQELGAPLFRIERKKVYLTEYGKEFQPYCERVMESILQGKKQIVNMKNSDIGNINLGYVYSTGSSLVPTLIEAYHDYKGNNRIAFVLKMANSPFIIENVKNNILDFGILPLINDEIEGISTMPIYNQELFLITSKEHPFSKKKMINVSDLENEKIVALDKESDLYERTEIIFKDNNIKPNFYYDVDELNSMAAFVSANMGIGLTPYTPVLKSYDVAVIPFNNHHIRRNIYIVWNSKIEQTPAMESFLDFVKLYKY